MRSMFGTIATLYDCFGGDQYGEKERSTRAFAFKQLLMVDMLDHRVYFRAPIPGKSMMRLYLPEAEKEGWH